MKKIYHNTTKNPQIVLLDEPVDGSWIHLESPTDSELELLSARYKLDIGLLKDGIDPNETPRIEQDGDVVYLYTRFCLPEVEKQTTSPLLIMHGKGIVLTISRLPFAQMDELLSGRTGIITSKRTQLVLEIFKAVDGGFKRRINNASRRIWETRSRLDKDQINNKDFVRFIDIEEDLNDFLLALEPMGSLLSSLLKGKFLKLYEEDKDLIEDLSLGNFELIQLAQSRLNTLRNIREAYATIMANNLNRVFKLMTSITILMGIFTLITGVYSMNIALPAAHNPNAFWIILAITSILIGSVSYYFKKNRWF